MRTWSGMVELIDGDTVLGPAHADLAMELQDGAEAWWGELRGAGRYGLAIGQKLMMRLPDGRTSPVVVSDEDPDDVYHRVDVDGDGLPPF